MSLQQRITALAQAFAADIKALTTGKLNTNGIAADSSKLAGTLANEYYKRSNVLGTVSQSGGVPTGAIIERGSNANGEYTRWADGTQTCTSRAALPAADTLWTFPAAFTSTPTLGLALEGSLGSAVVSGVNGGASIYLRAIDKDGGTITSAVHRIAFGRWY